MLVLPGCPPCGGWGAVGRCRRQGGAYPMGLPSAGLVVGFVSDAVVAGVRLAVVGAGFDDGVGDAVGERVALEAVELVAAPVLARMAKRNRENHGSPPEVRVKHFDNADGIR